jgi:hypothetical protein
MSRLLRLVSLASTRRMLAPGAMAWAYSTSREISTAESQVRRRVVGAAGLVDLLEAGRGRQAEMAVEGGQVAADVGVVVVVDDGDRLAVAVAGDLGVGGVEEGDPVEAVGVADLDRTEG